MSTHIGAQPGQIARQVLLPGDPLRAKWIAETFLEDVTCYSTVRNMLGFTGTHEGSPISVQGTGMGLPSLSIYVNELIRDHDAQHLVRVGSCGSLHDTVGLRDVVLAISASTDSSMNRIRFEGLDYAPAADFGLLRAAHEVAVSRGVSVHVGPVFSADSFYSDRPELVMRMADFGVLAIEMEANGLYTLAAKYGRRALAVCTVSDHLVTGQQASSDEREQTYSEMVEVALRALAMNPVDAG
jgi:purine-nucleoside phosphorylase